MKGPERPSTTTRVLALWSLVATTSPLGLPVAEVAAQEEEIFNGVDLRGWKIHGTELWYVENGELVCESGPDAEYGHLATDRSFRDFDLTLEFKPEADGKAEGVIALQIHSGVESRGAGGTSGWRRS